MDTAERAELEPVADGEPARREDAAQRTRWREAITLVVATRVALMAVGYAAAWYLAGEGDPSTVDPVDLWAKWDARLLIRISLFGYTEEADPHATAFFPGFPLTVGLLSWSYHSAAVVSLLLNTVASIVAVRYLMLLGDEVGEGIGRRAGLLLLVFPTAVFLIAPYTEALFLAGAIPAFYYARRAAWVPAGGYAALAMSARFAGIFLVLGLIMEWFRRRRDPSRALLGLAIALAPLVAYCVYLGFSRGDPFYFVVDQNEGWRRELTNPITALVRTWDTWTVGDHPTNWRFAWRVEILTGLAGIGAVVWAARKKEWGYATFMGTLLMTLLVSTWYFSIPRMLLTMFPIVLFVAEWTRRRDGRWELVLAASAVTCAMGVIVFTQEAWFY